MIGNGSSRTSASGSCVFSTVADIAGLPVEHSAMAVLQNRASILKQTDKALHAVLSPQETGAFSHADRAALACRIARINGNERLALFYREYITGTDVNAICDPAYDGGDDTRLKAVLAFTDLVSGQPRDATEHDIKALQSAGISDPDIVRLAELNAFLAYHIKVIEGFVLMVSETDAE